MVPKHRSKGDEVVVKDYRTGKYFWVIVREMFRDEFDGEWLIFYTAKESGMEHNARWNGKEWEDSEF